jgi:hypothetical protein
MASATSTAVDLIGNIAVCIWLAYRYFWLALTMNPKHPPGPPVTLGNMREQGASSPEAAI